MGFLPRRLSENIIGTPPLVRNTITMDEYYNANREHWDARAAVHPTTGFYDVAGFLSGNCALNPVEVEEVGAVTGKQLLHLQCHFGFCGPVVERRSPASIFSGRGIDEARHLAARWL
jgi:hypothetical protein